ncbi:hydrophobic surface binding protein A-domain-containing protein [Pyrenochaeta sp. MPI-SDFR-AT-0127]|nr:hydrophobic surface binding protein A-domain-containing protein [Pyrenochaeta sp. MPI-SDFR-AT-0127]
MYFSITQLLVILPTFALCSVLPPSQRDILPTGQSVKQDVINIHNTVLALDATVRAYNGSPFPTSIVDGTPVLLGVAEIHRVNRAGFRHALAALPFSVEDSVQVIDTVVSTVNVSIPAATTHLKEKVAAFKEGLLTPVVIASLALLLYDHDTFSAATLAKISPNVGQEKTEQGANAVANIHNVIQDAIVFYTANAL